MALFPTQRRALRCSAAVVVEPECFLLSPTGLGLVQTCASLTRCVRGATSWGVVFCSRPIIAFFTQVSGASVCNYSHAEPLSLAFSPTTGRLWAVEGATTVSAYDLPAECSSGPLSPALTLPFGAVTLAGGIAVGLRSDLLYVVDMASSQVRWTAPNCPEKLYCALFPHEHPQVKVFNGSTGGLVATIGHPGGYSDGNTTVSTDKLWLLPPVFGTFANASHFSRGSFVAVDDDGDVEGLWVNDFGNRRILHLDLSGAELPGSVAYIPSTYRSAVHSGDPSRVFANFMEFRVDYSVPNAQGWALVRNWGAGLPESFEANAYNTGLGRWEWAGFQAIGWSETLGLTVGIVDCYPEGAEGSENGYVVQAVLLDNATQKLQMLQVGLL